MVTFPRFRVNGLCKDTQNIGTTREIRTLEFEAEVLTITEQRQVKMHINFYINVVINILDSFRWSAIYGTRIALSESSSHPPYLRFPKCELRRPIRQ
jgi:hypothetical protein